MYYFMFVSSLIIIDFANFFCDRISVWLCDNYCRRESESPSTLDEAQQDSYNSYNQQQVNEAACGEADNSYEPANNQDNCDNVK